MATGAEVEGGEFDFGLFLLAAIVGAILYGIYYVSNNGSTTICNLLGFGCPDSQPGPAPGTLGASLSTVGNAASSLTGNAPAGGGTGGTGSVSGSFWTDTYNYLAGTPNAIDPDLFAPLPSNTPIF